MTREHGRSRVIGTRPFSGHRFVQDGQVRIEWRAGGRRRTRTIGTNTAANRTLADQILEDALREARDRAMGRPTPAELSLAALLVKHLEDAKLRRSERSGKPLRALTLRNYQDYEQLILKGLSGATSAAALRKGQVREWITGLRRSGLAEGTIARAVDYLKQVYRWAAGEMELLEVDPIAGIRSPSRKGETPTYTREEGRKLLAGVLKLPRGRAWRFRLHVLLDAFYGARSQQPLQLRWTDVDFERAYDVRLPSGERVQLPGTFVYRQAAIGSKGQADRTLPMLPLIREAMLEAWNHRRDGSPWVIWNWRDARKPARYDSMLGELRKLERRSGVAKIRGRAFHAFRRAVATALVEALGVSQASQILGDTPAVILKHYLKPTPEAQAEAIRYLMHQWIDPREWQPDGNADQGSPTDQQPSAAGTGTYGTGPAGFEPATPHHTQPGLTDQTSGFRGVPPVAPPTKRPDRPAGMATKRQRTFHRKGGWK